MGALKIYPRTDVVNIRNHTQAIIRSVMTYQFDLDEATQALETIEKHLVSVFRHLSVYDSESQLDNCDYMATWLTAFFRMLNKHESVQKAHDFLFYGAALTIEKFLDDHHL